MGVLWREGGPSLHDQIIDFFGFKEIDTREKAEEYFVCNPDKNWVIRKSSVKDTKFNQFFVIMTIPYVRMLFGWIFEDGKSINSFHNFII